MSLFEGIAIFCGVMIIAVMLAMHTVTSDEYYEYDESKEWVDDFVPDTPLKVDVLASAIFKAENSKKYPYGIKSIDTKGDEDYARQICKNTIRNQIKRWEAGDKQKGISYLDSLQKRYCPLNDPNDIQNLNVNWISNVKYFLTKD